MIAIMMVSPWNKITTTSSPFVQVFSGIGITSAAAILNFVVLTAAMSATNSAIFSTSRTLHALATGGNAMERFAKLSKHMVPNTALHFSSAILFVVVILNYVMPEGIFNLISGVSTINFVFVWLIMLWCHLKFRKSRPEGVKKFLMPGYPYTDYASLIFFIAVLIFLIFDPETRVSLMVSIIWFIGLFLTHWLMHRNSVKTSE